MVQIKTEDVASTILDTPIGQLFVEVNKAGVTRVLFVDKMSEVALQQNADDKLLSKACNQLTEYFTGKRKEFDLPLSPKGTPFQQRVWNALCNIAYGEHSSYGDLAESIQNPKAVRAVGAANGRNPISIIVPCHRVIGKNGTLTGYAGGLTRKAWLLALESESDSAMEQIELTNI